MEGSSISVDELDICFSENKVAKSECRPKKDFVKEEKTELKFEKTANSTEKNLPKYQDKNGGKTPTWTRFNGQRMHTKHSPLPSLVQGTDRRGLEQRIEQQDTVWTLCTALNVPSKEQSPPASASTFESQVLLPAKRSEYKPGKTTLAPLQGNRKQRPQQGENEIFSLKAHSSPKGKSKKGEKEDDQTVHFTPISKTENYGQEKTDENNREGILFLSPTRGLKANDLEQNRRFSMPISPRLLRRFHRERFYSSQKTDEGQTYSSERAAIFSPPFKDFDSTSDKNDVVEDMSKDLIKSSSKRGTRKSLDANSMRFLSEIKVSLGREPIPEPNFFKVKTKYENYGFSASSETIFKDTLPEVVPRPNSKHVQSGSDRNRASSFTSLESLIPLEGKPLAKMTMDSPLRFDTEARTFSHLSLSPRLSRKR